MSQAGRPNAPNIHTVNAVHVGTDRTNRAGGEMILNRNLRRVCEHAAGSSRVLAVGVADGILNAATHVIDPGAVRAAKPFDPQNRPRFSEASWTQMDLCARPWPFPDKHF